MTRDWTIVAGKSFGRSCFGFDFSFSFLCYSVNLLKPIASQSRIKYLPVVNFYEFGEFRFDADGCVLFDGADKVVNATPKALKILSVLVESDGRVCSKDEIISRVWSDSFVEEANLSYNIFYLRRALGESPDLKFIETVPKRGYRFVAPVVRTEDKGSNPTVPAVETAAAVAGTSPAEPQRQPRALNRKLMIGALTAVLLVLATTAFVWLKSQKTGEQIQADKSGNQDGMSIVRVTSGGTFGTSAISPDGKFIAYSQNYQVGKGTLYVRQTDTNTEVQLLESADRDIGRVAFSPDGKHIYYLATDPSNPLAALYRIPVLGGQPTRILDDVLYYFTISPDGNRAAFFRADRERKQTSIIIAALDGSGSEQTVVTFIDDEKSVDSVPAFSPDGKRLAFGLANAPTDSDQSPARVGVFTIEIDTGEITRLTEENWRGIGMMHWMPDASGVVFVGAQARNINQIYFLSYPDGELRPVTKELGGYGNYGMGITADGTTMIADVWEFSSQMWEVGVDGKTQDSVQLTVNDFDGGRGFTSMPDGQIVYTTRTGSDFDLWTLRDSRGRREGKPLTSDSFAERDPVATPDGKYLVFSSDRAGGQHLFRMDANGDNVSQLTFGPGIDVAPDISPDGKWIVYNSNANNRNRIWKLPFEGGTPVQLTDFDSMAPSFSPDGTLVACTYPGNSFADPPRVDVVSFDNRDTVKSFTGLTIEWNYRGARWTPTGDALIYQRNDKPASNLWKQSLSGGEPKQFTDFTSQRIYYHGFSRDGSRLLVSRGDVKVNVVLLKNFKPS